MPAIDLYQGPQKLSRYDVIGQRAEGETLFVQHVGLLDENSQLVEMSDEVSVVHMGPPLEQKGTIKAHVVGYIPLMNDEIKKIETWLEKIIDEYPRSPEKQYIIHPPWKDEFGSGTGTRRYRRYSCAGFVLDGYRQVDIELLNIEENTLPVIDKQLISSAYPDVESHPGLLSFLGLEGDGPWKIVLAGYLLHALNRSTNQIRREPYQATEGDEQF